MIRREIYIVDDLSIKTLININIMKFETIILNIVKNLIIIKSCNLFQISIFTIIKNSKIDIVIINKTRYIISTHLYITIFIKFVNLSIDRDLIFESNQLNILTLSINIVDYNFSRIVIRNNIDLLIIFDKYIKFDKMLKYKITKYFQIDIKKIFLINKFLKNIKSKIFIKRVLQKLLYIIAIFNINIIVSIKIKHFIDIIIYNDIIVNQIIVDIVDIFFNL